MKVVLPWPDKGLSPNARLHWSALREIKASARLEASWETIRQVPPQARLALAQGEGPIRMFVSFTPPDKRHRDADNQIASMKAALDGIADALKVNDARFLPSFAFCEPEKPGRVEVSFD